MDDENFSKIETEFISNEDPQTKILSYIDFLSVRCIYDQLKMENKMASITNLQGVLTLENLLRWRNEILKPYRIEYNTRMSTKIKKGLTTKIDEQIDSILKDLDTMKIEKDHKEILRKLMEFRGILTKLEVYVFNPKTIYDKAQW